jgi:Rrf2 family protein
MAETYGLPGGLLAKVLQRLAQEGFVASQHGKKGGYTLARPAGKISVAEVVEAIDGTLSLTECSSAEGACLQFETCNVKSPLQRLHDRVTGMLSRLTIAQMVEQESEVSSSGGTGSSRKSSAAQSDTDLDDLPVLQ